MTAYTVLSASSTADLEAALIALGALWIPAGGVYVIELQPGFYTYYQAAYIP